MLLQADKYSCGAVAIVNALRALGQRMTIAAVSVLAATDPVRGTSDTGVRRALRRLGWKTKKLDVVGDRAASAAVATLRGHLVVGQPALLSVDVGEHWVAAVGILGERVLVADSADADLVRVFSPGELLARWRDKQGEHDLYSGIVIAGEL